MDPDVTAGRPADWKIQAGSSGARLAGRGAVALFLACAVLPWLNPLAGGPSAVIQPWLVAAACTLMLWVLVAPEVTRMQLGASVAVGAALVGLGHAAPPVLLAVGGLIVIAISAAVGAALRREGAASLVATAWLVAALASSAFAIAQYFGLGADLAPLVNPTSPGEAFANLRQRNQFATLTSIGLVALLWRVQQGVRLHWAVPAAVLLAAANAASASRTGALQVVLVIGLAAWWVRPMHRAVAAVCAAAALAYAAAAFCFPLLLHALLEVDAPNAFGRLVSADGCASRTVLWGNVLHLIAQKPWFGWGWGELDFAHFATLYPGPRFCDILDNAHNLPLHLAVELGVPVALLACAGFIAWLAWRRPWRETDPIRRMAWAVIAVILLHSLLEYPLWYGPFQMAFGLALGLLVREPRPTTPAMVGAGGRLAVAGLLSMALLFSAWDYLRISQIYIPAENRTALFRRLPLPQVGDSWLYRDQVGFAVLSITPLTRANAARMNAAAMELLHYSPEPRVIDVAIESAMVLRREDQALWLLQRYRAAFPAEAAAAAAAVGQASRPASQVTK
ncbi:Wzy polymerase domain-containing protein [Caenimonas terrae]|uniref:Wzy polymerase domain-containing protein n=1 Tax=Caenimonas terrae TaxID=696074 RepID=A0ABW0N7P7_9BURK